MRGTSREHSLPAKTKAKKTGHGGRREGAGRKSASALTCPMCVILARQLELAQEREKGLMRQIAQQSGQIGTVISNKFETVRISGQPLPEAGKAVMPLDQLVDVETVEDEQFVETVAGMMQ
jgi:hypothetical protein